jgi:hypothetical protein
MAGGGSPKQKGEVTLAKEAAARLSSVIEGVWGSVLVSSEDLDRVLKHYAKLTRTKVSRKGLYVKGREYEYELRDYFTGRGLACRRVMQSGGGVEKDDLVLTTGWGEEYRLEAKRVAKLPAYLLNPQAHATLFRQDRGETLVMLRLPLFGDLCQ